MIGVPRGLGQLFVAAGNKYHIPPRVLAGVAHIESAMGSNRGPSSAGAVGLMQFMPGTARGLGINPYNDRQAVFGAARLLNQYGYQSNPLRALGAYNGGPGNPQYGYARQVMAASQQVGGLGGGGRSSGPPSPGPGPGRLGSVGRLVPGSVRLPVTFGSFDSAGYNRANARYIAGSYLQQTAATNPWEQGTPKATLSGGGIDLLGPGLLSTTPPNPGDFQSTVTRNQSFRTLKLAHNSLQGMAGGTPLNVHPSMGKGRGRYVNPVAGFSLGRTDMGVDASARVGTPIRAIGDSQLTQIIPNWFKGQPLLLFRLLNGPRAGQYWYVSEQISPRVRQGQVVHAGQPVASFAGSGTGIEIGWGSPSTNSRTLAGPHYHEGAVTREGVSFRNFLHGLGARG